MRAVAGIVHVGPVAVGFVSSRTIVSVFAADQLPAPSSYFAQTVFVPFAALSVQLWVGA